MGGGGGGSAGKRDVSEDDCLGGFYSIAVGVLLLLMLIGLRCLLS